MIYPFECECGLKVDSVRKASESHLPMLCSCGRQMKRVWCVPGLHLGNAGYYDYGLGKYVTNKRNAMSEIGDRSQTDLVEIGTDTKAVKAIKPKLQSYDLPRGLLDD